MDRWAVFIVSKEFPSVVAIADTLEEATNRAVHLATTFPDESYEVRRWKTDE